MEHTKEPDGRTHFADSATLEYIARLEQQRDEGKRLLRDEMGLKNERTKEVLELRQQLAECERERDKAMSYGDRMNYKLATVTKERDELVKTVAKGLDSQLVQSERRLRYEIIEQLATVTNQRDELVTDAERYRLLRRGQHWSVIDGIGATLRAVELDSVIDAALAKVGAYKTDATYEVAELRQEDLRIETIITRLGGGFGLMLDNGIRITHKPTGIFVEELKERSQHRNRQIAMDRLKEILVAVKGE